MTPLITRNRNRRTIQKYKHKVHVITYLLRHAVELWPKDTRSYSSDSADWQSAVSTASLLPSAACRAFLRLCAALLVLLLALRVRVRVHEIINI